MIRIDSYGRDLLGIIDPFELLQTNGMPFSSRNDLPIYYSVDVSFEFTNVRTNNRTEKKWRKKNIYGKNGMHEYIYVSI